MFGEIRFEYLCTRTGTHVAVVVTLKSEDRRRVRSFTRTFHTVGNNVGKSCVWPTTVYGVPVVVKFRICFIAAKPFVYLTFNAGNRFGEDIPLKTIRYVKIENYRSELQDRQ